MPFEVKQSANANEMKLEITGTIDESGTFPDCSKSSIIRLNLQKVKGINSTGIRNFVHWGELHKAVSSIRLENCPSIFVKNFSMITDFLKPNMILMSFLVPFYSEETNESKDVVFVRDRDFFLDGRLTIPNVTDSLGHNMDIDVDPKTFFAFLKK